MHVYARGYGMLSEMNIIFYNIILSSHNLNLTTVLKYRCHNSLSVRFVTYCQPQQHTEKVVRVKLELLYTNYFVM